MAALQRRLRRRGSGRCGRRRTWLEERFRRRLRPLADRFRDLLVRTYGEERGRRAEYVEAFEASEYGAPFDAAARARLFPFAAGAAEVVQEHVGAEWADTRTDD